MPLPHLEDAIRGATDFLSRQLLAGDYGLSCTGSDGTPRFSHNKGHVFTGFFVAAAMADLLTEVERSLLLVRILSEENEGLWGFSPPAPYVGPEHEVFVVDADDTAYVLRTLRLLGVNRTPKRLLAFHRHNINAFATFNAPGDSRLVGVRTPEHNLLAHAEVNANVFIALRGTNFERYINYDLASAMQSSDGHWESYFYPSPLFGTYLFLELIHDRKDLGDAAHRGISFVEASQNPDGSWGSPGNAFDTALALNTLAVCRRREEPFFGGINYLLKSMEPDGSWPTAPCIWQFQESDADMWQAFDTPRCLATATCTTALRFAHGGRIDRR